MKGLKVTQYSISALFALLIFFAGYSPATWAAPIGVSPEPLPTINNPVPNIYFTFDDSGSMRRANLGGSRNSRSGCAASVNLIYYNPAITYLPGKKADGSSYDPATFGAAWYDPYLDPGTGPGQRDLAANITDLDSYTPVWRAADNGSASTGAAYSTDSNDAGNCGELPANIPQTAFYFNGPSGGPYTKVTVSSTSGPNRVRPELSGATSQDETTNFANWFSYYRTRNLMSKTTAGRAFATLEDRSIRIAYQRLNTCDDILGNTPTGSCPGTIVSIFEDNPAEANTETFRSDFYTWLYDSPADDRTPLRSSAQVAGRYLRSTGTNNPFAKDPGRDNASQVSCRQNFHIIFTDGRWNEPLHSTISAPDNIDGTNKTSWPTCPTCSPVPSVPPDYIVNATDMKIYEGAATNDLSDITFQLWVEDAQGGLTNNVPTYIKVPDSDATKQFYNYRNDPAYWQHMVHFTISLGGGGGLTYPTALPSLESGGTSWPSTTSGDANTIDDLWHAAINGRGEHFQANNPEDLVGNFSEILARIKSRSTTAAPVSANGGAFISTSRIYQVTYKTKEWSGAIQSFKTNNSTGAVIAPAEWDSGTSGSRFNNQLVDHNNRNIITRDATGAVAFRYTATAPVTTTISAAQKLNLNSDSTILDYLRGDGSNEGPTGFRTRTNTKMGDVVNSGPVYVGNQGFNWPDSIETAPYSSFVASSVTGRTPVVYFGANDGMVHGIDAGFDGSDNATATAGTELIAYVPNNVYPKLKKLSDRDYQHDYYVDATPTFGDAHGAFPGCASSPCWRTVLVGGLGAGGKSIYALDVTNPAAYATAEDGTNPGKIAIWEYTETDLGLTYGKPVIARVRTSSSTTAWAVIFGNGYNSTSEKAVLYIVNIADGTLIQKIDTGATGSNGLSAPAVVDVDGDFIIDIVYAGDLQGNMWKFNLLNNTPSNWSSAFTDGGTTSDTKVPLFVAVDGSSNRQPITTAPLIILHPDNLAGYLVYFGTGKYIGQVDTQTNGNHSFYAIWDKNDVNSSDAGLPLDLASAPVPSAVHTSTDPNLLQQTVGGSFTTSGGIFETTSSNAGAILDWRTGSPPSPSYLGWYLDLPTGEKQIGAIQLGFDNVGGTDRVIFTTVMPNSDPCGFGGNTFLNEISHRTGNALTNFPFDTDGDGVAEGNTGGDQAGSRKKSAGVSVGVTILNPGGSGNEFYKYQPGSTTLVPVRTKNNKPNPTGNPNAERQTWRQLQ